MSDKQTPRKKVSPPIDILGGENARREVTGCPTGLSGDPQLEAAQQPGGGGAPDTGDEPTADQKDD